MFKVVVVGKGKFGFVSVFGCGCGEFGLFGVFVVCFWWEFLENLMEFFLEFIIFF